MSLLLAPFRKNLLGTVESRRMQDNGRLHRLLGPSRTHSLRTVEFHRTQGNAQVHRLLGPFRRNLPDKGSIMTKSKRKPKNIGQRNKIRVNGLCCEIEYSKVPRLTISSYAAVTTYCSAVFVHPMLLLLLLLEPQNRLLLPEHTS